MEQFKVVLTGTKKSSSGNQYFLTSFQGKDLSVVINSKWPQAEKEAKETKTKNKQPSFLLRSNLQDSGIQYNGTGATWAFFRKEGRVHQGTFLLDSQLYLVDIRRIKETGDFELQLTPKEQEVGLNDF